ncbi:hypothetical protein [Flavobacterium coralii]|uniref:hypothetical protein n=1 Tax=Flavobacterium coralii TaxID=2838017 RepID=UPI000C57150D|nr:hypothetical protein [Flavobacterium sp.]|tara:strand:+ start:86 stop:406 length:321 start_codon:yes stop_codon:yes gene_type:complete
MLNTEMENKQHQYTVKILGQLQQLFENGGEHTIAPEELKDNANAADFFHALANLAPAVIYNNLTGKKAGSLEFNHIANRLCFQNAHLPGKAQEEQPAGVTENGPTQ